MSPSTARTNTGVKCGNTAYHGTDVVYHANAASVRECYANSGRFGQSVPAATRSYQAFEARSDRKAAERMGETREQFVARVSANAKTEEQKAQEARNARYDTWRTIPVYTRDRGYYALVLDGKTRFFRIERPSKGQYRGRTFVSEQASDVFGKMPWGSAAEVMDKIAADPQSAALLYAREIERCSRCNRTLTDDDSRARGMGEDCAKKAWG